MRRYYPLPGRVKIDHNKKGCRGGGSALAQYVSCTPTKVYLRRCNFAEDTVGNYFEENFNEGSAEDRNRLMRNLLVELNVFMIASREFVNLLNKRYYD